MHETTALVTGASGFMGRNLGVSLRQEAKVRLIEYDVHSPPEVLEKGLREADIIFHLAGINRPDTVEEYERGNTDFTANLCERLRLLGRPPKIIFSSSVQAELDNPYGVSKRKAEEALRKFAEKSGSQVVIFRLKNVFGKWCRPNYNSVSRYLCNNIARDLPISISDPAKVLDLIYVDDVCGAMIKSAGISILPSNQAAVSPSEVYAEVSPSSRQHWAACRYRSVIPTFSAVLASAGI